MYSQLELLKERLVISEAEFGPDNPYVKGLKQQIASIESRQPRQPVVERFSGGMRGPPVSPAPRRWTMAPVNPALAKTEAGLATSQAPSPMFGVFEAREGDVVVVLVPDLWGVRINGVWSSPSGWKIGDLADFLVVESAEAEKLLSEARMSLSDSPDRASAASNASGLETPTNKSMTQDAIGAAADSPAPPAAHTHAETAPTQSRKGSLHSAPPQGVTEERWAALQEEMLNSLRKSAAESEKAWQELLADRRRKGLARE